jgi:hypothetical protein
MAAQALRASILVQDMDGPNAHLEAFLHEREQDFIFVFVGMKKGADVTSAVQRRAREIYRTVALSHHLAPWTQEVASFLFFVTEPLF